MVHKIFSFLAVGLLAGIFLTSGLFSWLARGERNDGSGKIVLKLAHALPSTAPVHQGMKRFAELVTEKSGGQVEVQIFPSGQLGSETETIEQLQRGVLAMVKTSAAAMEGFVPEMAIFGVPYLFRNEDHYWRVLEGEVGRDLLAKGTEADIHGLCYYAAGARSFYTVPKPANTPADLDGLKIRTMRSATSIAMIDTMGGAAAAIPFGELYTALQQGMVDGAENNPPSFYDTRHWEVARFYSLDEHTRIPDMLVFSKQIWVTLPAHVQGWITESAAESVPYQREVWRAYVAECLEKLRAEGVTLFTPNKEPFREAVQPLVETFKGTPMGNLIAQVKAIK